MIMVDLLLLELVTMAYMIKFLLQRFAHDYDRFFNIETFLL